MNTEYMIQMVKECEKRGDYIGQFRYAELLFVSCEPRDWEMSRGLYREARKAMKKHGYA